MPNERGAITVLDITILDSKGRYKWNDLKKGVPEWKYCQYQQMKSQLYATISSYGYFIVNLALIENKSKGEIIRGKYGKPFLDNHSIHFNISHSGNKVAVGISDEAIGIDIEKVANSFYDVSEWYLSESEKEVYGSLKRGQQIDFLSAVWTLKEAYGKLIGQGLNYPLKKVTFYKNGGRWRCIQENGTVFDGQIITARIDNNYMLSVCTKSYSKMNIRPIAEDEVIRRGKKVDLF